MENFQYSCNVVCSFLCVKLIYPFKILSYGEYNTDAPHKLLIVEDLNFSLVGKVCIQRVAESCSAETYLFCTVFEVFFENGNIFYAFIKYVKV